LLAKTLLKKYMSKTLKYSLKNKSRMCGTEMNIVLISSRPHPQPIFINVFAGGWA
jgi:hypothetical protein